jgi:RimJ/RimL family protein N-acetyltransferase
MAADPEVMKYLTGYAETPMQTMQWLARAEMRWRKQRMSWWAIIKDDDMVGAAALQRIAGNDDAPIEIGWRLARAEYHKGYATEAARTILAYATAKGLREVYAVADPANIPSQQVMKRISMRPIGIQIHYDRPCATYLWTCMG